MWVTTEDAYVVASWIGFGLFHSLFASDTMKQFVASVAGETFVKRYYRAAYNLLSLVWVRTMSGGFDSWSTEDLEHAVIAHTGVRRVAMDICGASAIAGFLYVCTAYDMLYFAGLREVPSKPLSWSALHRYMRHPCILATSYFFIGSIFEEERLKSMVGKQGEVYRHYCTLVPSIIPRPWKYITQTQAASVFQKQ